MAAARQHPAATTESVSERTSVAKIPQVTFPGASPGALRPHSSHNYVGLIGSLAVVGKEFKVAKSAVFEQMVPFLCLD